MNSHLNRNDFSGNVVGQEVDGKRQVLFLDGHVELIDEEMFLKQARVQKWAIKGVVKKEDVPREKQERTVRDTVALLNTGRVSCSMSR